jgi:hypothetical protein
LVNFPAAVECARCGTGLSASLTPKRQQAGLASTIIHRALICILMCMIVMAGFYLSLIGSAKSVSYEDKKAVTRAINVLRERGFVDEVFLLENLAAYRSSDNWLNASVEKENAYAATNFPFEIITLYPDFFTYPIDDTERAAILLHESKHLAGMNEHDAYEYVWKHREQLGWTIQKYYTSAVWQGVRKQTKDNVPLLFVCDINEGGDCSL